MSNTLGAVSFSLVSSLVGRAGEGSLSWEETWTYIEGIGRCHARACLQRADCPRE